MITHKEIPWVYIFSGKKGKESWTAERQRERVCER
jgi:hypothetical protein